MVVKRDGSREPWDRDKLEAGIRKSLTGRPVTNTQIDQMLDRIQARVRKKGPEVASSVVGAAALAAMQQTDEVGYLRYASVYKDFQAAGDFERELGCCSRRRRPRSAAQGLVPPGHRGGRQRNDTRSEPGILDVVVDGKGWPLPLDVRGCCGPSCASCESHGCNSPHGSHKFSTGSRRGRGSRVRRRERQGGGPLVITRGGRRGHPEGLTFSALLHHRGRAPVRPGRMGDPRRGHPELQGGRQRLRAARRRVPDHVVPERHQHRRPEVLPRPLGTPQRESSVRQLVGRVVDTITGWGTEERLLRHGRGRPRLRRGARPTCWSTRRPRSTRRCGSTSACPTRPQQCSACFILAVDDHMSSILNWYVEEGTIFKGGSGSGINLSPHPLVEGAAGGRRHGERPGQLHARRRRDAPARSSPAARRAAPPRWSS